MFGGVHTTWSKLQQGVSEQHKSPGWLCDGNICTGWNIPRGLVTQAAHTHRSLKPDPLFSCIKTAAGITSSRGVSWGVAQSPVVEWIMSSLALNTHLKIRTKYLFLNATWLEFNMTAYQRTSVDEGYMGTCSANWKMCLFARRQTTDTGAHRWLLNQLIYCH